MPTYDFQCPTCGVFELYLKVSEINEVHYCTTCKEEASMIIINTPHFGVLNTSNMKGHARNEKSSHEPAVHKHCSHEHKSDEPKKDKLKSFANNRPWMISH